MTTSTLSQETTITQYSSVIMNYSNSRARGGQACPSLYEPDPGARPPPSHDSASDHTALSSFSRRAPLSLRGNVRSSAYQFTLKTQAGLANDIQSGHIGNQQDTHQNLAGQRERTTLKSFRSRRILWTPPRTETTTICTICWNRPARPT